MQLGFRVVIIYFFAFDAIVAGAIYCLLGLFITEIMAN